MKYFMDSVDPLEETSIREANSPVTSADPRREKKEGSRLPDAQRPDQGVVTKYGVSRSGTATADVRHDRPARIRGDREMVSRRRRRKTARQAEEIKVA